MLPLRPFFTRLTISSGACPWGPWDCAMQKARWTLNPVATEADALGGSLRLLPPPRVQPDTDQLLLRRALVIDAADPRASSPPYSAPVLGVER